jgi:hypothetical protein
MPGEMTVPWDFVSTTMLVVLEDATQVWAEPQSWDGGHPPQVPWQPSSPQVFAVQSGVQLVEPPVPPSGSPPDDALEDDAPCPPVPVLVVAPPVLLDALVVPEAPPDPAALEEEAPPDAVPLPDEPQPAHARTLVVRDAVRDRGSRERRAILVISWSSGRPGSSGRA